MGWNMYVYVYIYILKKTAIRFCMITSQKLIKRRASSIIREDQYGSQKNGKKF